MPPKTKDHILIVDDKAQNIYALEQILSGNGRSISSVTSGNEALKLALNHEIDLIILDVQMPDMDGFEVAQLLKSNKKTKDTPIIFVSAEMKEHKFMMKGFEEGANDYLHKPLDPEITEAKVSVLLQLHRQKKELMEKNAALQQAEAEIRQLNNELNRNLAQMQLVNKELESFSYSVSHDLRAPLRSINGYAQIILEEYTSGFDPELKRLFDVIQSNAQKMGVLIDDLLGFARMGRKEVVRLPVDCNQLVTQAIKELEGQITEKARIIANPLKPCYADPALLSQVFINLISNAVKYSSRNENPKVEINSYEEGDELVYYVKDNGVGFNMEYAHKLFGVFQRLHSNEEFEGTGVGLAIVQRIIVKHGGRVWAEGQINDGATFYFTIPKQIIK